ncbi:hypothetical protein ACFQ0M_07105 [Kitasatospora aburaviensis]
MFGAMTAVIDGLALAALLRAASGPRTAPDQHQPDAGPAGRRPVRLAAGRGPRREAFDPQRRWRFAMTGALTAQLLIPMVLAIALMIHPPTFVW